MIDAGTTISMTKSYRAERPASRKLVARQGKTSKSTTTRASEWDYTTSFDKVALSRYQQIMSPLIRQANTSYTTQLLVGLSARTTQQNLTVLVAAVDARYAAFLRRNDIFHRKSVIRLCRAKHAVRGLL
eukprot:6183834-Pleurochrysis_carterae.AAC.3